MNSRLTKNRKNPANSRASIDKTADAIASLLPLLFSTLGRMQRDALENTGLARSHLSALFILNHYPDCPMGVLSHRTGMPLSNTTLLIDRLVALELVKRSESPSDRRVTTISLSGQGKAFIERHRQRMRDLVREKLTAISVEDQPRMLAAIGEMREVLEPVIKGA
jgi:DNA-binding MarR family transcriptional regulator